MSDPLRGAVEATRQKNRYLLLSLLSAAMGVLLCSTAVGPHFLLDDYVLALSTRGSPLVASLASKLDLFTFASGDPMSNGQLMQDGVLLPWWGDPELKISFFRPLSSLLHRAEFAWWPESVHAMQVHSLLWLGATVTAVGALYRKLHGRSHSAMLAVVLFALHNANGAAVSWVSNRNLLLGVFFCALTLLTYDANRRKGGSLSLWGLAWLAAALGVGEIGVISLCYLFAYAVTLDSGTPLQRARALLGPVAVTLAWLTARWVSGAGVSRSGAYIDPLSADFLLALPARAFTLLGASLGPASADTSLLGSPTERGATAVVGAVILVCTAVVAGPVLRTVRLARFWTLGTVLCLFPLSATFPTDRLLPAINLGAMPLAALALVDVCKRRWNGFNRLRQCLAVPLFASLTVIQVVLLPLQANRVQLMARVSNRSLSCLEEIAQLEGKTLLILGGPTDFWVSYLQLEREWKGLPRPRNLVWIAHPGAFRADLSVPNAMELTAREGFFSHPVARLYRTASNPLEEGQAFRTPGVTISVGDLGSEGAPRSIRLQFDEPLSSNRYAVLAWSRGTYELLLDEELFQTRWIHTPSLATILLLEMF